MLIHFNADSKAALKKKKKKSFPRNKTLYNLDRGGWLAEVSGAQFCLYTFCRNIMLCDLNSCQGLTMIPMFLQLFEESFVPQRILGIVPRRHKPEHSPARGRLCEH